MSILDIGDGVVEVRATAGDTHLGGDDFDRRIVDYLADQFQRDNGIDLRSDPQALQRLFEAAEKAKVELSSVTQTTISLPFITADASGPKHLNTTLMRSTFEQITALMGTSCRCSAYPTVSPSAIAIPRLHQVNPTHADSPSASRTPATTLATLRTAVRSVW